MQEKIRQRLAGEVKLRRPYRVVAEGRIRCTKCDIEKPIGEFRRNRFTTSGYGYHCLDCLELIRESKRRVPKSAPKFFAMEQDDIPAYFGTLSTERRHWTSIVEAMKDLGPHQCIHVPCENHYKRHHAIGAGLRNAADSRGVVIRVMHSELGVYAWINRLR